MLPGSAAAVDPKKSTWDKVVKVFTDAGIEFIRRAARRSPAVRVCG
jgi:hypothetical protein